jgi:hypothetical protein
VYKDHAVAKLERKKGDVGPNYMLVVLHLLIEELKNEIVNI